MRPERAGMHISKTAGVRIDRPGEKLASCSGQRKGAHWTGKWARSHQMLTEGAKAKPLQSCSMKYPAIRKATGRSTGQFSTIKRCRFDAGLPLEYERKADIVKVTPRMTDRNDQAEDGQERADLRKRVGSDKVNVLSYRCRSTINWTPPLRRHRDMCITKDPREWY